MLAPHFSSVTRCLAAVGAATVLVVGCGDDDKAPADAGTPMNAAMEPINLPDGDGAAASDPAAVVVTVDGESLTQGEVDKRVQMLAARQGVPPQAMQQAMAMMGDQLKSQVVDQFIDTTVLYGEAKRRKIEATDADVDAVLESIKMQIPPDATIESVAAAQGVTMDEVRADIGRSECLRKLFEQATTNVPPVTEEAVTAFYTNNIERFSAPEQATARHILIASEATDSEEDQAKAAAKAEALRVQLVEGGDFAELAKANSACPSKDRGGALDPFGRGQMAPPFEAAAFSQEIDAIGPVVKTDFGYHVIQVTAREDGRVQTLEEVHDRLKDYMDNQQRNEHFGALIEALRDKAEIKRAGETDS